MIQRIADLPQQQQIVLGLVAVGVLFLFWNYVVSPLGAEVESMKGTIQEFTVKIETAQATASRLAQFEEDVAQQEQVLATKRQLLPDEKETAEIVRQVQSLAVNSNLEIKNFTPEGTTPYDFYEAWPIKMSLEGSYNNLGLFFQRVAQFQRLINVSDIQITALGTADRDRSISATCTATTFVFLEEAAAN